MGALFFVCILASKGNGTLYVGVTNNLVRRYQNTRPSLFAVSHANTNSTNWSILKRSIPYLKLAQESIP